MSTSINHNHFFLVSCKEAPNRLQKDFFSYYLRSTFDEQCTVVSDSASLSSCMGEDVMDGGKIVVFDCHGMNRQKCLRIFNTRLGELDGNCLVVLVGIDKKVNIGGEALRHQVKGLFYADDSLQTLEKGLRAVMAGELWFSRKTLTDFHNRKGEPNEKTKPTQKDLLTSKERQVLALVANGSSNEEIAEKLRISVHTVKTHLYNIFKKIKINNRIQATLWAAKNL